MPILASSVHPTEAGNDFLISPHVVLPVLLILSLVVLFLWLDRQNRNREALDPNHHCVGLRTDGLIATSVHALKSVFRGQGNLPRWGTPALKRRDKSLRPPSGHAFGLI